MSFMAKIKRYKLTNYHCKLLSPFLTEHGILGRPVDFPYMGDQAFEIERELIATPNYGCDRRSAMYLRTTLEEIQRVNDNDLFRITPLHVDADGYCLVHAISRALVGRQIFWHVLRAHLKNHLETFLQQYKQLLRDIILDDEWKDIITEADPNFRPLDINTHKVRAIHLFGLANVLHRPIILLDSLNSIMESNGAHTAIFVPALIPEDECKKGSILNRPLLVAWSSASRNHLIPLVGVRDKPVLKIPQSLLPKVWGMPNSIVKRYIEFDSDGNCFVGGRDFIDEISVRRLIKTMDGPFKAKFNVSAKLVSRYRQFFFGREDDQPESMIKATKSAVENGELLKCLPCDWLYTVTRKESGTVPTCDGCYGHLGRVNSDGYCSLLRASISSLGERASVPGSEERRPQIAHEAEKSVGIQEKAPGPAQKKRNGEEDEDDDEDDNMPLALLVPTGKKARKKRRKFRLRVRREQEGGETNEDQQQKRKRKRKRKLP